MSRHSLYMLDTDICSYIFRLSYPQLLRKLEAQEDGLCVSSITAYELLYGGCKKGSPKLLKWIHIFLHKVQVVEWNSDMALKCAELRARLEKTGTTVALDDLMIAAAAIVAKATVVTHNTRHFEKIPGIRLDDWVSEENSGTKEPTQS